MEKNSSKYLRKVTWRPEPAVWRPDLRRLRLSLAWILARFSTSGEAEVPDYMQQITT